MGFAMRTRGTPIPSINWVSKPVTANEAATASAGRNSANNSRIAAAMSGLSKKISSRSAARCVKERFIVPRDRDSNEDIRSLGSVFACRAILYIRE